jgi:DNA-binding CsgD family transcriptional regulator
LESNLKELGKKFGMALSKFKELTPKEAQICNMIKNGLSTKEIAQFFKISGLTIGTHRTNIRKKLKISNHKANLAAYLQQG